MSEKRKSGDLRRAKPEQLWSSEEASSYGPGSKEKRSQGRNIESNFRPNQSHQTKNQKSTRSQSGVTREHQSRSDNLEDKDSLYENETLGSEIPWTGEGEPQTRKNKGFPPLPKFYSCKLKVKLLGMDNTSRCLIKIIGKEGKLADDHLQSMMKKMFYEKQRVSPPFSDINEGTLMLAHLGNTGFRRVKIIKKTEIGKPFKCLDVDSDTDIEVSGISLYELREEAMAIPCQIFRAEIYDLKLFVGTDILQRAMLEIKLLDSYGCEIVENKEVPSVCIKIPDTGSSLATLIRPLLPELCKPVLSDCTFTPVVLVYASDADFTAWFQVKSTLLDNISNFLENFEVKTFFMTYKTLNKDVEEKLSDPETVFMARWDDVLSRVKVEKIKNAKRKVKVRYIDFGNEALIDVEDLYNLYIVERNMQWIPPQSILVKLLGISSLKDVDELWKLTDGQELTLKKTTSDEEDGIPEANLYLKNSTDEHGCINALISKTKAVQQKYAPPLTSSSSSSVECIASFSSELCKTKTDDTDDVDVKITISEEEKAIGKPTFHPSDIKVENDPTQKDIDIEFSSIHKKLTTQDVLDFDSLINASGRPSENQEVESGMNMVELLSKSSKQNADLEEVIHKPAEPEVDKWKLDTSIEQIFPNASVDVEETCAVPVDVENTSTVLVDTDQIFTMSVDIEKTFISVEVEEKPFTQFRQDKDVDQKLSKTSDIDIEEALSKIEKRWMKTKMLAQKIQASALEVEELENQEEAEANKNRSLDLACQEETESNIDVSNNKISEDEKAQKENFETKTAEVKEIEVQEDIQAPIKVSLELENREEIEDYKNTSNEKTSEDEKIQNALANAGIDPNRINCIMQMLSLIDNKQEIRGCHLKLPEVQDIRLKSPDDPKCGMVATFWVTEAFSVDDFSVQICGSNDSVSALEHEMAEYYDVIHKNNYSIPIQDLIQERLYAYCTETNRWVRCRILNIIPRKLPNLVKLMLRYVDYGHWVIITLSDKNDWTKLYPLSKRFCTLPQQGFTASRYVEPSLPNLMKITNEFKFASGSFAKFYVKEREDECPNRDVPHLSLIFLHYLSQDSNIRNKDLQETSTQSSTDLELHSKEEKAKKDYDEGSDFSLE